MSDNLGRVGAGLLLLIAVWILVYWWYEPAASAPRVSAAATPAVAPAEPDPVREPEPLEAPRNPPPDPASAPADPTPVPATLAPTFTDYTIRRGDTARSISQRVYGTPAHAAAIARANPLMDIATLEPGRVIRIPADPANVQGVPVRVLSQGPSPVDKAPADPQAATDPAKAQDPPRSASEYKVQPGDSLARISRRLFGSERYVDELYEANRDRLPSKEDLKPGQILTVPDVRRPG